MDSSEVTEMVDDMRLSIDDLESALAPLLNASLASNTSKLPLLDKAKLYVLATYAIDSVLFSYLRLNGQNIKEHPVVQEITRVRSYFQKIKEAETGPAQRTATLDKDAAARFIKHGLSGNDKYDQARQDRLAAEKAGAKRKAEEFEASAQWGSQNRFANVAKRMKAEEASVPVVEADDASDDEEDGAAGESKAEKKAAKHQRRMERKMAKQSPADSSAEAGNEEDAAGGSGEAAGKKRRAPRSNHETFEALLNGPIPKKEKKSRKRKSKGDGQ